MKTILDTTNVPGVRGLYRLAICLAAISAAFCLVFCVIIALHFFGNGNTFSNSRNPSDPSYRKPAEDSFNSLPTDQPGLLALRQNLAKNRQDETIKTQIRELDQKLRLDYFNRRTTIQRTIPFLLISAIIFFVALRTVDVLQRQIPDPNDTNRKNEAKGSWYFVIAISWLMLFGGIALGLQLLPSSPTEQIILAKAAADLENKQRTADGQQQQGASDSVAGEEIKHTKPIKLTEEILAKHWVSFRNFDGNGIGFSENPPTKWNGKTGENIVWKADVPLPGKSSPVIWEDKLFVTGGDETMQKVFCYSVEDGKLLWEADVTKQVDGIEPMPGEDTGFAAPTPAVDGQHVFAMFANGELVAVDYAGKLVWRKSFGAPKNSYGFASSPALCFDKLIVQFDNSDGEDGTSKIVALDLNTGNVLWETPRPETPNSWSSPMVKKIGDKYQIITCGNPFVIAYNPEDGKEIWRCKCLDADIGPSPVVQGNVVLVSNQAPWTTAIDATGTGDVTATHVLWTGVNAVPDTVSPLATEQYFMTLDSYGFLTGYDPKKIDGRKRAGFWELSISDTASVYSSPIRVGNYIYVFDKSEETPMAFVIDLSKIALDDKGKLPEDAASTVVIATNEMAEPCESSPAILNNRLYIRGTKTIYCIK